VVTPFIPKNLREVSEALVATNWESDYGHGICATLGTIAYAIEHNWTEATLTAKLMATWDEYDGNTQ